MKTVLVLGMHRSGTSAFAGILALLGVELGEGLLPGDHFNERGYFEQKDFYKLHDELLEKLGVGWDVPSQLPNGWLNFPFIEEIENKLVELCKEKFMGKELWGVKDPRICRLLPMWLRILEKLGSEPLFVHCVRNPLSVAKSLEKRDRFAIDKGLQLWLIYSLEALLYSRGHKRVFVSYEDLLKDWKSTIKNLSEKLKLNIDLKNIDDKVAKFLSPELCHNIVAEEIPTRFLEVYNLFLRLVADEPIIEKKINDFLKGCIK